MGGGGGTSQMYNSVGQETRAVETDLDYKTQMTFQRKSITKASSFTRSCGSES